MNFAYPCLALFLVGCAGGIGGSSGGGGGAQDHGGGSGGEAAVGGGGGSSQATGGGTGGGTASQGGGAGGGAAQPTIAVKVTPHATTIAPGQGVAFAATVLGSTDQSVTWTIQEGAAGGSVTAAGQYTAPSMEGNYHLKATSHADPTKSDVAAIMVSATGRLVLTPGQWTEITPAGKSALSLYWIKVDPSNPDVLYATVGGEGIYKSKNAGATWDPVNGHEKGTNLFLDGLRFEIDPNDSTHMYGYQGVMGTLGFWVSHDSGVTWLTPQGFRDVGAMVSDGPQATDIGYLQVDPDDFNHVLLGYHSPWKIPNQGSASGIVESRNGGETWTYHLPPSDSWGTSSRGIHFLHNPDGGTTGGNFWLATTEAGGIWRTVNAGQSWAKVSNDSVGHTGVNSYYTKSGTLYVPATPCPLRSFDDGQTWSQVTALATTYYWSLMGDGTHLYVHGWTPDPPYNSPYKTSLETDGLSWTSLDAGPVPRKYPVAMTFDPINRVLYSANTVGGGLWALRVQP
jgi:hypothetical protein